MKLHNTEIILYKLYPCNNRRELLYAEGQYIKKLIKQGHKLANKVMSPVRSIKPKSLSKTQKTKLKAQKQLKKYNNQPITCECGFETTQQYYQEHLDSKYHTEQMIFYDLIPYTCSCGETFHHCYLHIHKQSCSKKSKSSKN